MGQQCEAAPPAGRAHWLNTSALRSHTLALDGPGGFLLPPRDAGLR